MPRAAVDPVHRLNFVVDDFGCWLWQGVLRPNGYATISERGRTWYAHRLVYDRFVGPIPDGLHLDHLCRVRHCVNPAHLEPVTQAENNLRGMGWSGRLARRTHCANGHEFTPENTMRIKTRPGVRRCRSCEHARYRKSRGVA